MPIKEYAFGESSSTHHQFPLRSPKGKLTQERWIVATWGKDDFSLSRCVSSESAVVEVEDSIQNLPYSKLWASLSVMQCWNLKHWLIGHGTGYALDRADFTGALERGDVCLPKIVKGNNKGKHGGKLTLSRRVTEVDVLCGPNKIKLLDWLNFAVPQSPTRNGTANTGLTCCLGTLRTWLSAMQVLEVQVSKTTAAQQGWSHARNKCLSHTLNVNLDPACRALERRAYHAGRNECFRLGRVHGSTHSLDVKSCYATICCDESLPYRMIEEFRHGMDAAKINCDGGDHWIADVVVKTDAADYPVQWQGTSVYPVGRFLTSLPWPELRRALRAGHVVKVLRAARYEADYVLRDYAAWYMHARELVGPPSVKEMQPAIKAMFNASLGYTARQKYDWRPWDTQIGFLYWLGVATSPDDGSAPVQAQKLKDERRWLCVAGEPREAMPFLHATICSYARVKLLEIFASAGRGNVLYCDTDGVLVTSQGAARLQDHSKSNGVYLHGLVRRFTPGQCTILGQKAYRVGENVIHAGVVDTRLSSLAMRGDSRVVNVDREIGNDGKYKAKGRVLTCRTGRASFDGKVEPFVFDCHDEGGESERWVNVQV